MKNSVMAIALMCGTAVLAAPETAYAAGYVDNQDAAVASSVRVVAEYSGGRVSYGTGWVISEADAELRAGASMVVTALHVLRLGNSRPRRILILPPGEKEAIVASIVEADYERDLVFLEVKNLDVPAMTMTTAPTVVAQNVGAVGYTGASDRIDLRGIAESGSFVPGAVSRLVNSPIAGTQYSDRHLIQHSVAPNVGFSGGPLVDQCGRVVGVNLQDGGHISLGGGATLALAQGVAMAIASDEVVASAREAGIETTPDNSPCTPVAEEDEVQDEKPEPLPCPEGQIRGVDGSCIKETTDADDFASFLTSPKGIIAIVAGLGLLGAGFALFRILNSGNSAAPVDPARPAPIDPQPVEPRQRRRLTLTGSGPDGEPVNLSFDASIGENGKRLGRDCDEGRIPDNRSRPGVSREHAKVFAKDDGFLIADDDSTNGTSVNGRKLQPNERYELRSGDTVSIADVKLHVSIS